MLLVDVRQVVVFDAAGDAIGIAGSLGNHAQNLYPAFERTLQMLSMWIMGWDFDRTNQVFAFGQGTPHQTKETTAAQIASNALDRLGTRLVAKHQDRPMQPRPNSFAPLKGAARD